MVAGADVQAEDGDGDVDVDMGELANCGLQSIAEDPEASVQLGAYLGCHGCNNQMSVQAGKLRLRPWWWWSGDVRTRQFQLDYKEAMQRSCLLTGPRAPVAMAGLVEGEVMRARMRTKLAGWAWLGRRNIDMTESASLLSWH